MVEKKDPADSAKQGFKTQRFQMRAEPKLLDVKIVYPRSFEQREQWPLLIMLHGRGERSDKNKLIENCLSDHMLDALNDRFVLLVPECPKGQSWPQLTPFLDAWIKEYISNPKNRIDAKRVYLTGYSMGGFGTLTWATLAPTRFAAIAPLCAGGGGYWLFDLDPETGTAAKEHEKLESKYTASLLSHLTDVAVRIYHAPDDDVHPISDSQLVFDQIQKVNNNVSFMSVDGECKHKIWPKVYGSAEFYDWLLTNKR